MVLILEHILKVLLSDLYPSPRSPFVTVKFNQAPEASIGTMQGMALGLLFHTNWGQTGLRLWMHT